MKPKKWIFISLTSIIFLLIFNTLLMIWIDSYSIAHPQQERYYSEPNRNFLKIEYIRTHPTKYDSFIFGSSKVGAIDPYIIQEGNFYNMTYSAGIPHEHLINIKLFLRSGVKIKHLLIGLENISYLESFQKRQHQGITKAHPLATQESWFNYYRYYFFRFPTKLDRSNLINKLFHPEKTVIMDVFEQEAFYKEARKKLHASDLNSSMQRGQFKAPGEYHGNALTDTLDDIQEIVSICQKNHIDVKFFINPISDTTYAVSDKKLLLNFKESLSKITDYYDFSGPNSITKDESYWADTTHFDLRVGDYILQSLYHYGNPPKDFAHYVSKH